MVSHQAASGYLSYDPASEKFTLPPEQAMVFAVPDSPVYMQGGFDIAQVMMENQALVEPAFRTGRCWLGRSVTNQLTAPKHPVSSQSQSFNASRKTYAYLRQIERLPLTGREKQLCLLLTRDQTRADIADAMGVSEATVISHRRSVFDKLGVHSRIGLIEFLDQQR